MLRRSGGASRVVGLALVTTLGVGASAAVLGLDGSGLRAAADTGPSAGTSRAEPMAEPLPAGMSVEASPGEASPVAPPPVAPPPVAPLGDLRAPDLVVTLPEALAPGQLAALRGLEHVTGVAVLDTGTVELAGVSVRLAGADPSELRHFVPQVTAASDPLWQAVARGELAVGHSLGKERGLPLGASVPVGPAGQPARIGALAAFGLPVDVVTSRAAARSLGAAPDRVLVISAPGQAVDTLQAHVTDVVGEAQAEVLRPAVAAPTGKPRDYRELYIDSARYCPGLRWQVLAAIGEVESGHGRNLGPSSAGALGPMQFLPSTWAAYGVDGDGDGQADLMNPFDAVPGAASYLCRFGANRGEAGLYDAIFAYNHADWYVQKVLATAERYR